MSQKINIPTPSPKNFNFQLFSPAEIANNGIGNITRYLPSPLQSAANIGVGKLLQNAPPEVSSAINFVLHPSPQEIIDSYIGFVPDAPVNTMAVLNGSTLNNGPIFSDLEIDAGKWTDFSGNSKSFNAMQFTTVLITAQQNKSIVETQIQGSDNGAVLEYSGLNNYSVTINIIIAGSNGIYPQSSVDAVIKMLNAPIPIKVHSWFLQNLDIYQLVVKSYDINQERGSISQQAITIQAQSANTTTLIIQ